MFCERTFMRLVSNNGLRSERIKFPKKIKILQICFVKVKHLKFGYGLKKHNNLIA